MSQHINAQTCTPTATYTLANGNTVSELNEAQSAPIIAHFEANPSDYDDYSARFEWRIYEQGKEDQPLVHRFEETLDYTFSQSGTFYVQCYATFVNGSNTVVYPEEGSANPFVVNVLQSRLEMPNAFSPNGDDRNEIYRAKENHQSIISFKATIFNRWGQRLYTWTDINGGWDGTVNGRKVKDGVYFVNVVAKGADGHEYHIRKDVNVLTGVNKDNGTEASNN